MKRLLEWKQRMLQSPLSRKLSGSSNRGTAQNELFRNYKPVTSSNASVSISRTPENCVTPSPAGVTWNQSAVNDGYALNEVRTSRLKNVDMSAYQQMRSHRDRNQEDRNSTSSVKYNSESSDSEGKHEISFGVLCEYGAIL